MNRKAFTLFEGLVVTAICVGIGLMITSTLVVGRDTFLTNSAYADLTQSTRFAMDRIVNELKSLDADHITVTGCIETECVGDVIEFQAPIITNDPVAGTYDESGQIKWGIDGWPDEFGYYYVPAQGENQGSLVRKQPIDPVCGNEVCETPYEICDECIPDCGECNPAHCGNEICEPELGETCSTCSTDCGPCHPGCLLPGTSILMADGTNKFIEDIVTGDKVTSYDEDSQVKLEDIVKEVFMHEVQGYLIINDNIKTTAEHPFFANGAWVKAGKLKQGDILLTQEEKEETITSIEAVDEKIIVYNIEVNPYHNYFANGYLVHNKDLPAMHYQMELRGGDCPPDCGDWTSLNKFFRSIFLTPCAYADMLYGERVLTQNIDRITFTAIPDAANPEVIKITILAKKNIFLLGRELEVTLHSAVNVNE